MESLKRDDQIANWKSLIQAWMDSDMTIAQWCRENKLSENFYYYWLKVIRRETLEQHAANTLVPESIRTRKVLAEDVMGQFREHGFDTGLCQISVIVLCGIISQPCCILPAQADHMGPDRAFVFHTFSCANVTHIVLQMLWQSVTDVVAGED